MWDDAVIGMHHLMAFEKIAVVSDVDWVGNAIRLFGFAMPCPVNVFTLDELDAAKAWIVA